MQKITNGATWVQVMFALIVFVGALGNLSQTGLNAMMLAICNDFSLDPSVGQWLTTAYMLVLGIVVPLSAYVMGRFTSKQITVFSTGLFTAGLLISALAPHFLMLLIGRIIQAIAAGFVLPFLATFAVTRFPEGKRATAMGIAGIALGFAPNVGPTVGGFMVDMWGWRSFFILLFVLSLALTLFAQFALENLPDALNRVGLDMVSYLELSVSFCLVLWACTQASQVSILELSVWLPFVLGIALFVVFILRQRGIENPLISLDVFKSSSYNAGFWVLNFLFASFMGVTLIIPLYVEGILGGTALDAGLVLLPTTIVALVVNPLAGMLTDHIGIRPVAVVSSVLLVAGSVSMVFCNTVTPLWVVCVMQVVRSLGVSGLIPSLSSWYISRLNPSLISSANAFSIATRQTLASFGTALMMVCVSSLSIFEGVTMYQAAFGVSALFALLCLVIVMFKVR